MSAGKKYRSCIFGSRKGARSTENAASETTISGVISARLRRRRRPIPTTTPRVRRTPTGQKGYQSFEIHW